VRMVLDAASPGPGTGSGHEAPIAALGVRTALLDAYAAAARLLGRLPDISQVRVLRLNCLSGVARRQQQEKGSSCQEVGALTSVKPV